MNWFLVSVVAMMAVPALGMAQGPAEEDIPADDLSEVNGYPVKVGEHGEYRYSYPKWNVSSNPLGWIVGSYGLSLSYATHANLAVRGDISYANFGDDDYSSKKLNLDLPIYFRKVYHGVFLEPGLSAQKRDDEFEDATLFGPQVLVGWHGLWDSGLNISMAGGVGRNWSGSNAEVYEDDLDVFINGYLRFGYAF